MWTRILKLIWVAVLLTTINLAILPYSPIPKLKAAGLGATRGVTGDLWADKVLGKRDFTEISPRKVVPDKVASPGGVIVDRSVIPGSPGSPGRAYVWDSGNNRILGIDLEDCYAKAANERCSAAIIIGQPSDTDYGACNRDSSFQYYPERAPASASTLCGVSEYTATVLEDKSFSSMFVDSAGNLWVADVLNHRVLKYISPFTTDNIADEVWGQASFTENECNRDGGYFNIPASQPTANTLCFAAIYAGGAGVTLDSGGNLWVADGGNSRVLRFPNISGTISKTADLVLGQTDFTTGGDYSGGSNLDEFNTPTSLGFDSAGVLYIADAANTRILKYTAPFTNGMPGVVFIDQNDFIGGIASLQMDTDGLAIWTYGLDGFTALINRWDLNGNREITEFDNWNPGGGSIGIDALGNILISAYVYGNDVLKYEPSGMTYAYERNFFQPPGGYNLTAGDRLEQGGWGGMRTLSNGQLLVTDGRLMFWNNPFSASNGAAPDGYVDASSPVDFSGGFVLVDVDANDKVYVQKDNSNIAIYQGPLTSASTPIKTLSSPFNLLGGGTIALQNIMGGMVVSDQSEYLWLTDPVYHRAFRIRDPLGASPVVDVVLGQTDATSVDCNRGLVPPPNVNGSVSASLNMICNPGPLAFDNFGNLYVSDHFFESGGNWRILMFAPGLFPDNAGAVLYAPLATKEFPRNGWNGSTITHAVFEMAFDSNNRMVVGYNPYIGPRFINYYNNPQDYNPLDRADPTFATPAGSLKDFYGWAFGVTFDSADNLYIYDTNRGKLLIYSQPFTGPELLEVTPVGTTTVDTTPNITFSSNQPGAITYGGSCSSASTVAAVGNNTISFNTLALGSYSNCTITVASPNGITDTALNVSPFTITDAPLLTNASGPIAPSVNATPSYTFYSSTTGIISYGGSCSSASTNAATGNNTISFNALASGTYSDCTITVTRDSVSSNALLVPAFTILKNCKPQADFNSDCSVNLSDLSILASYWNQNSSAADANNDGAVNLSDLSILAQNWLKNF